MIKKIISTILIVGFTGQAYASCPKPAQYFKDGETVNCNVYAFSVEKHEEIIIKVKSYDLLKEYSLTQDELLENKNKQISNLNKIIDIKEKKERMSDLEKVGYFLGGIAVMYFATKTAKELQ